MDKVWDPIQPRYKKMGGQSPQEDMKDRLPEQKGLILRRRRDVASDEEVVAVVRHKGDLPPRRPRDNGRGSGAVVPYRDRRGDDHSDSEGSVPPRSRVRARSTAGRSRRRGSPGSSESSSELPSSTDEERQCRKIRRKKWITAGLATVATVHAASKVYSSIEKHDKAMEEVKAGKMSPEEAHKKLRASRWQDAAAVGIAALGIGGAISEWNEVHEEHAHHKELLHVREEHHQKRLERERRRRAQERDGYYTGRGGPKSQSTESYRGGGDGRYDGRQLIEDEVDDRRRERRGESRANGY